MKVRIGTAPDSWGVWFPNDPKQTPWKRFLDEVVQAGYEWIELGPYGYLPTDLATLERELNSRKLKVSGSFVVSNLEDPKAWLRMGEEIKSVGEILGALGSKFLVLIDETYTDIYTGELTAPRRLDSDSWKHFIEAAHKAADLAHWFGLELVFHPHADTHVEYEDQVAAFLEDTDSERVSLCLDTGHFAYGGGDPVRLIRRHHHRVRYLHLKSVDPVVRARVKAEKIPFVKAVGMGVFSDLSEGVVDFPGLRDILREVNYDGWATVEQDMYPAPFDKPLPIAKRNRAYLREIGLG